MTLSKTGKFLLATSLVVGTFAVHAQTNSAATNNMAPAMAASQATTVGVTPLEAKKAVNQAVPRSNVATVVRTAPNAVDATTAKTAEVSNGMGDTTMATTKRKARADRN